MALENLNRCMHDDCFTCPYRDCISNTEPAGSPFRTSRTKLSEEERIQRRREQQKAYRKAHSAQRSMKAKERYNRKKATN